MEKIYKLLFLFLIMGMSSLEAQISLPYSENFGTITVANGFPTVSGGAWTRTGSTTVQPTYITNQASYNRSGNGDTKFIAFNYSSATNYYIVGPFSLTGGTSYTSSVLYKADGSTGFGPLELRYGTAATGASQTNLIATVPANITNIPFATISGSFTPAVTGSYYMSIKCTANGNPWYLTLDDYALEITNSCTAPTALNVTNLTGTTATIGWTPSGAASSYDWEIRSTGACGSGSPLQSGNTVSSSVNLSSLTANTTYTYCVRSACAGPTNSGCVSRTFFTGYCIPAPTSVDGLGITNVSFSTVNNTTVAEPGNYGDYSAQVGNIVQGNSTIVNITYKTGFTYDTKIWIDWNDDLDFVDVGEEVYTGTSTSANPTTLDENRWVRCRTTHSLLYWFLWYL